MKRRVGHRRRLATAVGSLLAATLRAAIALGITELALRLKYDWVTAGAHVLPPMRRLQAFRDVTYDVKLSDGDLFYWMRGDIAPLRPEEDRVLACVRLETDAGDFRNPPSENGTYDIIALGDSFTFAGNVAAPWPEKLAEYAGVSVLNLGEPGAGPQIQLEILRHYGMQHRPHWVIMAYFEGNDLYDAAAYEVANPFLLTRIVKHLLSPDPLDGELSPMTGGDGLSYPYPISITINDTRLEMAFFSYYVAWLSASSHLIESSRNFRLVKETILEARQVSETMGAQFLLVYVPSKPHLYLPYVQDGETIGRIYARVPTMELDDAGFIQFVNEMATPQLVGEHMADQGHLLAAFAAAYGINFLDLTPSFQERVAMGEELYYPFDTHWNQCGHDLAAHAVDRFLKSMLVTTTSDHRGAPLP